MYKYKSRIAMFLAVLMVLSIFPYIPILDGGRAEASSFGGGSGTSGDPYLIYNLEQFMSINSTYENKYFKLMNDLDFADIGSPLLRNAVSLGKGSHFLGGGYTIRNYKGTNGVFDCSEGEDINISNLKIVNAEIEANAGPAGILVNSIKSKGRLTGIIIRDSSISEKLGYTVERVGGVIGGAPSGATKAYAPQLQNILLVDCQQ